MLGQGDENVRSSRSSKVTIQWWRGEGVEKAAGTKGGDKSDKDRKQELKY